MTGPVQKAFLYKAGKAEIFLESEVEAKLDDGWWDNPGDAKVAMEASKPVSDALGESAMEVTATKTEDTPASQSAQSAPEPALVTTLVQPKQKRTRRTQAQMRADRAKNPCQPAPT